MSESDTTVTRSSITRSSASTTRTRKKHKNNVENDTILDNDNAPTPARVNQSHTAYFFRKDPSNNDVAYCILCEQDTNTAAYPYSRKGGSTSNISNHLRDRHGITKFNYLEYLDVNNEVN